MAIKMPTGYTGYEWVLRLIERQPRNTSEHFELICDLLQYSYAADDISSVLQVAWDGFQVRMWGYRSETGPEAGHNVLAWDGRGSVEFKAPWQGLTLDRAEAITTSLRQVERGLGKLAEQVGERKDHRPATYGALVQRVMRVLGISMLIECKQPHNALWASGRRYRTWSVEDTGPMLDDKGRLWLAATRAVAS